MVDDMQEKTGAPKLGTPTIDFLLGRLSGEKGGGGKSGRANISRRGDRLIKVFDKEDGRGVQMDGDEKYGGTYEEASGLIDLMREYRGRLCQVGFPVPSEDEGVFLVGELEESGAFVPVEVAKNLGGDLEGLLRDASGDGKAEIVKMILEVSYPALMADDIGVDIKPANFVINPATNQLFHIDPLPVIMQDRNTGMILTEWPLISDPEIQEFLRVTHLTPQAIGYRFYQELCQGDPENRIFFQGAIREVLAGWLDEGKMDETTMQLVIEAMTPLSSQVLSVMVRGEKNWASGTMDIRRYIDQLSQVGSHPIYALREMAFLLSERLIQDGVDFKGVTTNGLDLVERGLGKKKRNRLESVLENTSDELRLLTLVRKLTHLSHDSWRTGKEEEVALEVILGVASTYFGGK